MKMMMVVMTMSLLFMMLLVMLSLMSKNAALFLMTRGCRGRSFKFVLLSPRKMRMRW